MGLGDRRWTSIRATYQAQATFTVRGDLALPEDSRREDRVREPARRLLCRDHPGGSEFMLAAGDEIVNTQGSVSLLNLLMRFGTGQ